MISVKSEKKIGIELIRIISIFLVIFNHTGTDGFMLFTHRLPDTWQFWLYLFISVFCKAAVPLFFMISGALLLEREQISLKQLYFKKILKIIIVLVIFSFLYYAERYTRYGIPLSAETLFKKLYSEELNYHLWYLYAYIAFLIGLPFLQSMVKNLKNEYFYYLIAITLFFEGIIPVLEYYFSGGNVTMNSYLKPSWLTSMIVVYPCMGYFIQNRLQTTKKVLLLFSGLDLAGIVLTAYMTYYKGKMTGVFSEVESQTFHACFVLLNAVFIFMFIKYFSERIKLNEFVKKVVCSMGDCTFGVFLIHAFVLSIPLRTTFLKWLTDSGLNELSACILLCFVVYIICFIITKILRKIPLIRCLL